jgi:N utilization substance protein A
MDPKTGAIKLYALKKAVETVEDPVHEMTLGEARRIDSKIEIGGEVRIPKNTEALGRISAQTAKQVIFQKVREAERDTVFQEYSGRTGELVNCTIKRVEGPDYMLDLGKTEAKLPKKEQSRLEGYSVGDRVRCVIKLVDKASKGPGVLVSRAAPELVMRLFEQEVPEIYDGTVAIKGCAREAGERTKIAVQSRDRDVDSVGACVGMKGMRVQSIIRELRGEKIDIIEYSDDPVVFATHALSPAKVSRIVVIDALEKHMEVIVDDSQLSLAIGKKGQNVRLAAKLLGWKIDIKSEEEKRQEVESQMAALVAPGAPVSVLLDYGMSDAVSEKLLQAGVGTIERLGTMTPEQLEAIPGIDPASVEFIQASVVAYYSQFEDPGAESGEGGEPAEPAEGGERPEGVEPAEGGERPEGVEPAEGGAPPEGVEPAEGGAPPEGVEPAEPVEGGEPVEGSSSASQPEEILLSGPADEEGEAPEGGDVAQAAPPMMEDLVQEPSGPASAALEVVSGEGPEIVEQFGTIEDAGSPHNHAEVAGAESVPKNSSGE